MKKELELTFFDTPTHGYISVSKKLILELGIKAEISGCSGHNLTRVFLEEDADATLFINKAKEKGYEIKFKHSYNDNPSFACSHNYNPNLFDWKPTLGFKFRINKNGISYKIITILPTKFLIQDENGKIFKVNNTSAFKYVNYFEEVSA